MVIVVQATRDQTEVSKWAALLMVHTKALLHQSAVPSETHWVVLPFTVDKLAG